MNLEERISGAVRHYWQTRLKQKKSQGSSSGMRDYGARADVTGGKHMDGFASLISELIIVCARHPYIFGMWVADNRIKFPCSPPGCRSNPAVRTEYHIINY